MELQVPYRIQTEISEKRGKNLVAFEVKYHSLQTTDFML